MGQNPSCFYMSKFKYCECVDSKYVEIMCVCCRIVGGCHESGSGDGSKIPNYITD